MPSRVAPSKKLRRPLEFRRSGALPRRGGEGLGLAEDAGVGGGGETGGAAGLVDGRRVDRRRAGVKVRVVAIDAGQIVRSNAKSGSREGGDAGPIERSGAKVDGAIEELDGAGWSAAPGPTAATVAVNVLL